MWIYTYRDLRFLNILLWANNICKFLVAFHLRRQLLSYLCLSPISRSLWKNSAVCLFLPSIIPKRNSIFWIQSASFSEIQSNKTTSILTPNTNTLRKKRYLQHSIGLEDACKERVLPLGWGIWIRKTSRTRVFFLPMSVSPFLSSMSEFLSFSIPAQSMLFRKQQQQTIHLKCCMCPEWHLNSWCVLASLRGKNN